jgi:beta-galactosidase
METGKYWILQLITIMLAFSLPMKAQKLYVGANYHPHDDKNIEKIKEDIELMKAAGLNVVRMGHLAWDSYEPSEGKFDFEWFDKVMDMMNQAGIKVKSLNLPLREKQWIPNQQGLILSNRKKHKF